MNSSVPIGRLTAKFREAYLRSLGEYRFYYDDLAELGSSAQPDHVFYFVPGINGTPGQMRFMLPSLLRTFGENIYVKALHRPEFSARRPTWEKYTFANVDRKLAQLRADLEDLLARFERVTVLCSSNGFYDFAAAAHDLVAHTATGRVHLLWGACAPDEFRPTAWEKVFFPLNGFIHDGARWFAFPNHDLLQPLNPETSCTHVWNTRERRRTLFKADLESRFRCCGLDWCYTSAERISAVVRHVRSQIPGALHLPADALVAANDGYWQGRPRAEIAAVIRRYLPGCHLDFQPTSHLWVVTPSHLTSLFERHRARLAKPVVSRDSHPVSSCSQLHPAPA